MPGGQPGLLSWPSTAQEQFSAHKGIGLQGASCGHRKAGTEHQRIQYPLNACLAYFRLENQVFDTRLAGRAQAQPLHLSVAGQMSM